MAPTRISRGQKKKTTPKCCAVRQWCLVIGGYEPPDRKYLGAKGQTSREGQVTTDH